MSTAERPRLAVIPHVIVPDVLAAYLFSTQLPTRTKLALYIAYAGISLQSLKYTTGSLLRDYGMGLTTLARLLSVTQLTWLTDALQFHHRSNGIALGSLSLLKRIYSGLCLLHTPRGVGWNCQVANIPSPRDEPRWTFVFTQVKHVVRILLLLDLARSFMYFSPVFSLTGVEARSIASQGYLMCIVNYIAWGTLTYTSMALPYHLLSAGHVALGLSGSTDWPDMFGSWSDAYTVRRFWGRTWQQTMRRWITAYGKFACQVLNLKPGSLASSYIQLYVGFIASGIMHTLGGNTMVGREFLGASFSFYLFQAVGITFEDAVIGIARHLGITGMTRLRRALGYVWVWAVWFPLTAPICIDWALRAGLGIEEMLPFSPVRYVLGLLSQTPSATSVVQTILSMR
ncbi:hypothetical protein OBBRIDRAFT_786684 [Obba rivulosa]|uniref:Wax synthase domain-containing protein n=1 Tax=Obba rivulosa TaxID=1052685 RepID=A0A8E2AGG9_9APHY|nr:hypothetical protein OBBRIDRAFT_786684 [Obba rivulosa]